MNLKFWKIFFMALYIICFIVACVFIIKEQSGSGSLFLFQSLLYHSLWQRIGQEITDDETRKKIHHLTIEINYLHDKLSDLEENKK